jgi:hypothetical protein
MGKTNADSTAHVQHWWRRASISVLVSLYQYGGNKMGLFTVHMHTRKGFFLVPLLEE